jgi:hypothetical protein
LGGSIFSSSTFPTFFFTEEGRFLSGGDFSFFGFSEVLLSFLDDFDTFFFDTEVLIGFSPPSFGFDTFFGIFPEAETIPLTNPV